MRFVALAAAVVVLAAVGTFLLLGGGEDPPATGAASLVPADALVYVHLSTDQERDAVQDAIELAGSFPGFEGLAGSLLGALDADGEGEGVDFAQDIRPWLGREAALALLNTRSSTAGSLIVLEVSDREAAQDFLDRAAGASQALRHRGTDVRSFGSVATAFVGEHLVIGQEQAVRRAIDLHAGRGRGLDDSPSYRRAVETLPEDRVADAYASVDGVRRLLAPQGGALGIAGTLLDQPRLAGTALALSPADGGARLHVHSVLTRAGRRSFEAFEPQLADEVPEDVLAYLGVAGLDAAAGRLLRSGLAQALGFDPAGLLERARRELSRASGGSLQRDVLELFARESALWLTPGLPAPVLTLLLRTDDEDATRGTLARLQAPLVRLFTPPDSGPGQAPLFRQIEVAGVQAQQLRLAPGVEIAYAVFDGRLVVSTSLEGIRSVRRREDSLGDAGKFERATESRPEQVTSLLFLDLSQLLTLGEQTGLRDNPRYAAVQADLRKLRSVGAYSTGGEADTTAELFFQIS